MQVKIKKNKLKGKNKTYKNLWDTDEKTNTSIMDIEKEKEVPIKDIENIFTKIITESFLNIEKQMVISGTGGF
jgi:hypothetical protein